ncbi:DUF6456 domain-containing protein [Cucumibacter marinus]|uniref:DUF6456 domain-containing protein n=1 Tax=Cucumibacter marinus TaxID=1121252 RepID=UPI00040FF0E3|nr:DUF6456 domain-containing protein [Cucumibacter marinus]
MSASQQPRTQRFIKKLIKGETAEPDETGRFWMIPGSRMTRISRADAKALVEKGVLQSNGDGLVSTPGARTWLRRQLAGGNGFADQHRELMRGAEGELINLAESPLARLAQPGNGEPPFLAPHHLTTGERIRVIVERSGLTPSVTARYGAEGRVDGTGAGPCDGIGMLDMHIEARRQLEALNGALQPDCARVVIDVCGHLKGLQQVEAEYRWPRRSAKMVLRVGLDLAAAHFGYSTVATGRRNRRRRNWHGADARPAMFPPDQA